MATGPGLAFDGVSEENIEAVREVLRALIAEYRRTEDLTTRRVNEARARIVTALATQAHAAGEATDVLLSANLVADAAAVARRSLEHSVIAAWMATKPGSVEAFAREKGLRAPAALAKAIRRSVPGWEPELLAEFDAELAPRKKDEMALKSFEEACKALNSKLYLTYRMFSTYVHPSGTSVQVMFFESEEDERAAEESLQATRFMAAHVAAASLVWAGRALDGLNAGQPSKARLKRAARVLAISPVLYPDMPDEDRWPM